MGPDRLAATCATHTIRPFGRVVDGDFEVYSIAGNESDALAPSHPAGCASVYLTVVGKPDPETGVAQGLDHSPLGSQDLTALGHPVTSRLYLTRTLWAGDKPAADVPPEVGVHGPR